MKTLLFVYHAKSRKLNALFDAGHKLFSPNSYQCNLCALTFDAFTENKTWKQFRAQNSIDMKFYPIDEFEKTFPSVTFEYPVILKQDQTGLNELLNKKDINKIESVDGLINHIEAKLLPS
jgi:hypothetical protein